MEPPHPPSSRSWSIHGRADVTARYEILGRVGSGAYSDVYHGRRRFDGLAVALKEIHDYQSALRELEALQALRGSPNVVALLEHFWNDDDNEDAVLVLEFLPVDLAVVIRDGRRNGGIWVGELKQWIAQILRGVDACHRNSVVHRDLKPENLLVSQDGMLKLADFGQARILHESKFISIDNDSHGQGSDTWMPQHPAPIEQLNKPLQDGPESQASTEPNPIYEDDYLQEIAGLKAKYVMDETDKETSLLDGDASCLATCSTGDIEDDPFKGSYSYEVAEGGDDESGSLTSCVGTRWYRAPELLYGSTSYGQEVDLWSLGCIFAELLSLQPLFSGMSDLDQLAKIISVLGDMNEATAPGCSKLPDYNKISFNKVENPVGLEECLPNRSPAEINLIKKLVCYDPGNRATAMELLSDAYFSEDPLPAPLNELRVPSTKDEHDDSSPEDWGDHRDLELDSDMEEFGDMDVVTTEKGFSMRFS